MIDRGARDQMAEAIRSYLDGGLTSFQLDDTLGEIADNTEDKTVHCVETVLWFHYDDVKEHKIVATKEQWDFFQRIILLLKSDSEYTLDKIKLHWRWWNLVGLFLSAGFIVTCAKFGIGFEWKLWLIALPFTIFGYIFKYIECILRKQSRNADELYNSALYPFPSFGVLRSIRLSIPHFCKKQYPAFLRNKHIRSHSLQFLFKIFSASMLVVLEPLILIALMVPENESETKFLIR